MRWTSAIRALMGWLVTISLSITSSDASAASSYGAGTLAPTGSFEADEHHTAWMLALPLSFLHLRRDAVEAGTAIDGQANLHYASTTYEVSAEDAATANAAPHGEGVLTLDGSLHLSIGSWDKVEDQWKHHGFGIQLAGGVSPASGMPTVHRSLAGSVGYTHIAVGQDGNGAEDGFNPIASYLHLHAGIGIGYWNVPHVHTTVTPCEDAFEVVDFGCDPAVGIVTTEPHTTDFTAVQFPVFSIEGRSGDDLGLHGAIELRGLPKAERIVEFRASGGIAPALSDRGDVRLSIDVTFEITRASASVHEYPEHGPDFHLSFGPQFTF